MKKELTFDGSLRYDGVSIVTQGENKKTTLTITREGIVLAVIEGDVNIDSVKLEGNTSLRIEDIY